MTRDYVQSMQEASLFHSYSWHHRRPATPTAWAHCLVLVVVVAVVAGRPRSAPRRSCSPTAHSGRAARGVSRPPVRAPLCRAEQLRPTGAWTVSGGGAQHGSYFTDLLDSEGLRHDFNNTPDLVPSPSSLSPCVHVDVVLCPHLDVVVANMVYF